jgi:hypothetical protein
LLAGQPGAGGELVVAGAQVMVGQPPAITSASGATFTIGQPGSFTVTAASA